jgi:hypothetical protein
VGKSTSIRASQIPGIRISGVGEDSPVTAKDGKTKEHTKRDETIKLKRPLENFLLI